MTSRLRSGLALGLMVLTVGAGWLVADGPIFLRWLLPEDPGDETIREYWEKVEREEATPQEMVDLGTMLFIRGYPKDAVRLFEQALQGDPELYEAWFRIGLVKHREGDYRSAEQAYEKCLKLLTGHGWCNFYMGLLQEQIGRPTRAIEYYRRAFKFAPELAQPEVNPQVLYSELHLAAVVRQQDRNRFTSYLPLAFLEPDKVHEVRSQWEPTPVPTPTPPPEPDVSEKPPAQQTRSVQVVGTEGTDASSDQRSVRAAPTPASRPEPTATPEGRRVPNRQEMMERIRQRMERMRPPIDPDAPAPTPTPQVP